MISKGRFEKAFNERRRRDFSPILARERIEGFSHLAKLIREEKRERNFSIYMKLVLVNLKGNSKGNSRRD